MKTFLGENVRTAHGVYINYVSSSFSNTIPTFIIITIPYSFQRAIDRSSNKIKMKLLFYTRAHIIIIAYRVFQSQIGVGPVVRHYQHNGTPSFQSRGDDTQQRGKSAYANIIYHNETDDAIVRLYECSTFETSCKRTSSKLPRALMFDT